MSTADTAISRSECGFSVRQTARWSAEALRPCRSTRKSMGDCSLARSGMRRWGLRRDREGVAWGNSRNIAEDEESGQRERRFEERKGIGGMKGEGGDGSR